MKREDFTDGLTVEEALQRGQKLPWAWIRSISSVSLGLKPETVDLNELLEARFFGPEEEIRIFRNGGALRAAALSAEAADKTIKRRFDIENPMFGSSITVRYTLEADEDGQMNRICTCLIGWEG